MNPGVIGGIIGGVVGLLGGVIGTYFSITNTKGSRERAFMIKVSVVCWVFVAAFVLGTWLLPVLYRTVLTPIYVVALIVGISLTNKRQAQIRSEESKRAAGHAADR
ncbi:MAG: hypothetical protein ABSA12_17100 [Verrucomicrobiia bacterium]|jgi:Ca2+/Na+ antiporter